VGEPETSDPTGPIIPSGWRRWVLTVLAILLLLTFLIGAVVHLFGYAAVKYFIQSGAGQAVASRSIGHAVKVDGEFAPLHLDKWTITTDSFTSTGWPGEAIGGLNAYGVRAEFDPSAIWGGVYKFNSIQIDRGDFILLTPNDALKRKMPPKKPKPWWAHFLPSVFQCGPIVTPDANVEFDFQGQHAQIQHAHLQADLIGRDFRYTADSGTMQFPFLPDLHINKLVVMVTRPMLTIEAAELTAIDPADPARLTIIGNMGQREDKTINAIVDVYQMPLDKVLPPGLASEIHGRATGHLLWKRDKDGKQVFSDGDLSLSGASVTGLSVFKQLQLLDGNPDLKDFAFDTFTLKFHMDDGHFTAHIVAISPGKFSITGDIGYEFDTKEASLDVHFNELPLKVWLPDQFKSRYEGMASAALKWQGQLDQVKDSAGALSITLDGTHINDPVYLRKFLATKGLRAPETLDFKTAEFDFTYKDQTFQLTRAQIDAPGVITASASGTLVTPDGILDADVAWQGLTLDNWLPPNLAQEISGNLNGGVKFHVAQWQYKDGSYAGDISLLQGQLTYTSVQSMMARWVDDKRLLDIPLDRAACSYTWNNGALAVTGIDLRGGDSIAIQGNLLMDRDEKLSGVLWVGVKPVYLKSLQGLGEPVFARKDGGLRWAKVAVSGTAKEPKQDLSQQLLAQLGKHPLAVFPLGGKALSWYVGNVFGAESDWKRPGASHGSR
jgi:hypothetical protein